MTHQGSTCAAPHTSAPGLLRAVAVFGLAASIFNCTVGGGIFRLPAGAAAAAGAAPFVYLALRNFKRVAAEYAGLTH